MATQATPSHLPCCHGDGLPASVQGLDPDKGTGVGWRGLHGQGGDRQDDGGTGRDVEESRDSEREAGTQKHEGTEMRGPRETI